MIFNLGNTTFAALVVLYCVCYVGALNQKTQSWGAERSRKLTKAWLKEQELLGGELDPKSGSGSVGNWERVPGAPDMDAHEAFKQSDEVQSFPEEEIVNAVKKTKLGEKAGSFRSSGPKEPLISSQRELEGYSVGNNPYDSKVSLSEGPSYDWFSQGYRMLGAFIDCDHTVYNECSRWMMWAAYINPNYQGGGWDEYYGYTGGEDGEDVDYSEYNENLDCHNDDTEWLLLGVYRMELYQFIEQLSKHLWEIDSYEYYAVTAAMSYMTVYDCVEVDNGYYGGPRPTEGGNIEMGVYSDEYCLNLVEDEDYDNRRRRRLSQDGGENYEDGAPESTLTALNEILDTFKMCRLCLDYPTYQDGYFIGDTGTDDGSIINQCWKFHSHNSYYCNAGCVLLGHKQGTIVNLMYGGRTLGGSFSDTVDSKQIYDPILAESIEERLKSNVFVTFSGVLFISTCIMYYVAKGSTPSHAAMRSKKLLKSKRLLEKLSSKDSEKNQNDKKSWGITRLGSRSRSRTRKKSKSPSKRGPSVYEPPNE